MKRIGHHLGVLTYSMRLGAKRVQHELLTLSGQFLTYVFLIVIYSAFYRAIDPAELAARHLTAEDMIWYIGGTEWPLFCFTGYLAKSFQFEIQAGSYENALLRPTPGWLVVVGNWFGGGLMTGLLMLVPCLLCTAICAGNWQPDWIHLIGLFLSFSLAGIIFCTAAFLIGASCLWLKQAEPVIWLFYKAVFLFGALTWPLVFYPPILAKLVWFTPFPALLNILGEWMQGAALSKGIFFLSFQLFWVCLFTLAASLMDKAILRHFQKEMH